MAPADRTESTYRTSGSADARVGRSRAAAIAAARAVLAQEGWDAVSHDRVAEVSGVHRATVYRQFPDRTALLEATVAAEASSTAHIDPTGLLRTDLDEELHAILVRVLDPAGLRVVAALVERAEWDERLMELKRNLIEEQLTPLLLLLAEGVRRGELMPDVDVRNAVAQLLGPLLFKRMVLSEDVPTSFVDLVITEFIATHAPTSPPQASSQRRRGRAPSDREGRRR